jgi:hypothetical protein
MNENCLEFCRDVKILHVLDLFQLKFRGNFAFIGFVWFILVKISWKFCICWAFLDFYLRKTTLNFFDSLRSKFSLSRLVSINIFRLLESFQHLILQKHNAYTYPIFFNLTYYKSTQNFALFLHLPPKIPQKSHQICTYWTRHFNFKLKTTCKPHSSIKLRTHSLNSN